MKKTIELNKRFTTIDMECMKELFRLKSMKEVAQFMQGKLASVSQTQYTQLQRMIKERKQGILAKYNIDFIVSVILVMAKWKWEWRW